MIRIKDIQEELKGLVGWEQSVDDRKEIDVDLTDSESGLYFQGAHPLLTLANIEAIMPAGYITLSDYLRRETNKAITTVLSAFRRTRHWSRAVIGSCRKIPFTPHRNTMRKRSRARIQKWVLRLSKSEVLVYR